MYGSIFHYLPNHQKYKKICFLSYYKTIWLGECDLLLYHSKKTLIESYTSNDNVREKMKLNINLKYLLYLQSDSFHQQSPIDFLVFIETEISLSVFLRSLPFYLSYLAFFNEQDLIILLVGNCHQM